jgi:hypothetical protein
MAWEMTSRICGDRAAGFVLAVLSIALAAAALGPSRAQAAAPHVHSFAITGSGGSALWAPAGVAVDNSAGPSARSVYVTDPGEARVSKFDRTGKFILMFGDGVNATTGGDVCTAASGDNCRAGKEASPAGIPAGAFRQPDFVAVDGSAGPSSGHVYVGDTATDIVSKFDSGGALVPGWGSGGQIQNDEVGVSGVAVGPGGNLVLSGYNFEEDDWEIFEYDQGGTLLSRVATGAAGAFGLAVDAAGNRYMAGDFSVSKVAPGGAVLGSYPAGNHVTGLAIDPFDGDLYVRLSEQGIRRYAAGCSMPCAPVASFGKEDLGYGYREGVAVDALDHVVYGVAEARGGVAAFVPPGVVPEASTGAGAPATQKVIRVDGLVDPAGAGSVTGCRFEYVPLTALYSTGFMHAQSVPCVPPPPYNGPQQISGFLSGLEGGTEYRYRLVATNSKGPRTGLVRSFRTGSMTEASTGGVTELSRYSATLSGHVTPGPGATVSACFFEYVEEKYALSSGFQTARVVPCVPQTPYTHALGVWAVAPRLLAGTTYRYRVSAWDAAGIGNGAERSLTTPADGPGPLDPPDPDPRPERDRERGRHQRKVHCAKKACARTFVASAQLQKWVSPKFPRSYGLLFSVHKDGKSLAHTRPAGGCISTFTGRGMIATLNGCEGRFKLTYIGSGEFSIRWRVFRHCRCGDRAGDARRRGLRRAVRMSR